MEMTRGVIPSSLREFANVLFIHQRKLVSVFLLTFGLGAIAVLVRPSVYGAEAKLLIRLGRENIAVDPSVSGPTVNPNLSRESDLNSELDILTSRPLAEDLVDAMGESVLLGQGPPGTETKLSFTARVLHGAKSVAKSVLVACGLVPSLSSHDKAVKNVIKSFSAQVEKRTNVISARYEADNPELARQVLDSLIRKYLARHIEVYSAQASPVFFEQQAETARENLARKEKALDDFREQHGITTMDRQQDVLLQQVAATENQIEENDALITGAKARIGAMEKSLAGRSATHEISRTSGRANDAADALKDRLADLRAQESDLDSRYPPTHRPLVVVREQIKDAERELAKEPKTLTEVTVGLDANYEQLKLTLENEQAQLSAQQARATALEKDLAEQRGKLTALASQETQLSVLTRDLQLAENDYRQSREHVLRSKTLQAMDQDKISNVSVVEPATALPVPLRPNRPLDLLLSFVAAALLAVLSVFGFAYFDDSLRTKEDVVSRIGVPVLAVVSDEAFQKCR